MIKYSKTATTVRLSVPPVYMSTVVAALRSRIPELEFKFSEAEVSVALTAEDILMLRLKRGWSVGDLKANMTAIIDMGIMLTGFGLHLR